MAYDINRITPTGLKKFEECPLAFYYENVLGLTIPQTTIHFEFGTAIHLGIDNLFEQCDEKTQWEFAEKNLIIKAFKDYFTIDKINDEGFSDKEAKEQKFNEMLKDGENLLNALWEEKEHLLAKGINPSQFEVMMKIVPEHPITKEPWDLPLSLRIDAIGNERVIEFKTSASKYDVVDTRMLPQTLAYVYAMYCKTGKIYSVDYIVLIKNRKKDRIQHLHYEYDIADLIAFDARVRAILDKIKNRHYNFGQFCKKPFCGCRKMHDLLDIKEYYNQLKKE